MADQNSQREADQHNDLRYAPLRQTVNELAALRTELAVMRSTLARHSQQIRAMKKIGRGEEARAGGAGASSTSGVSIWKTHLVLVAATVHGKLRETDQTWGHNNSQYTVVTYQRVDPDGVNYSPNLAYEAGVHIQFISEHYDDLPNQTIFLQEGVVNHNPYFEKWLSCVRPDADYAPFVVNREVMRGLDLWHKCCSADALVEQCWRDVLKLFSLSHLLPPRQRPTVGYYSGSLFLASRAQLRRHPRSAYERMHSIAAGGDGRCHVGALDWPSLNATRRPGTLEVDSPGLSKHTIAGAVSAVAFAYASYCIRWLPLLFCVCVCVALSLSLSLSLSLLLPFSSRPSLLLLLKRSGSFFSTCSSAISSAQSPRTSSVARGCGRPFHSTFATRSRLSVRSARAMSTAGRQSAGATRPSSQRALPSSQLALNMHARTRALQRREVAAAAARVT